MGAMRMVRGYSRGIFATIFSTVILNLLIWGIGAFVLALAVSILADFLLQNRIQETGDEDVTHIDSSNNKLRLLEENTDMLVFMAVGRRNRRAYINLDRDGRMIEYTGVVKL